VVGAAQQAQAAVLGALQFAGLAVGKVMRIAEENEIFGGNPAQKSGDFRVFRLCKGFQVGDCRANFLAHLAMVFDCGTDIAQQVGNFTAQGVDLSGVTDPINFQMDP